MKPFHGKLKSLDNGQCREFLEKHNFSHLACQHEGKIHVVPINYMYVDGFIYSHSKEGRKLDILRKNAAFCIQVEKIENFSRWRSVIAHGNFEELTADSGASAMRLLIEKLAEDGDGPALSALELDFAPLESHSPLPL